MLIESCKGYWSLLQMYRRSTPRQKTKMLAGVLPVYASSEPNPHIRVRLQRFIDTEQKKAA